MTSDYAKSYSEVLEFLKHIPKEEYERIPKSEIDFFESNKDVEYVFNFDAEKSFSDQELKKESKAIIVSLYKDYIASEKEKKIIEEILRLNEEVHQSRLREKYNPDDVFKDNNQNKVKNTNEELTVPSHNRWYQKVMEFFRKIFSK